MTDDLDPDTVAVPADLYATTINYLTGRPWREVHTLVADLLALITPTPADIPDTSADLDLTTTDPPTYHDDAT